MAVAGKKRSREHSLSRVGAEHSRDAGSARRSPKAGNVARQDHAAGSNQVKQQRGAHASGNPLHARAGKTLNKETHQSASAKASLQKTVARPDGGQAAPVLSTASVAPASADYALPPRKRRNKNKFKPDPEPAAPSAAPQHATADVPSRGTLPVASHHNTTAIGRPPQEPAIAAGPGKKKWKRRNKSKQSSDKTVSAPAQLLKVAGAEQPTATQSNASQAAANGKRHKQDVRTAKKALDMLSQGAPAPPAQKEAHRAGANAKGQRSKQTAHVEQADARQSGLLEPQPQRKGEKVHGHKQKSNGHHAASALQRAAPSAAGEEKAPGTAAAAKVPVQTVTAPPLPGVQSLTLSSIGPLLHAWPVNGASMWGAVRGRPEVYLSDRLLSGEPSRGLVCRGEHERQLGSPQSPISPFWV